MDGEKRKSSEFIICTYGNNLTNSIVHNSADKQD